MKENLFSLPMEQVPEERSKSEKCKDREPGSSPKPQKKLRLEEIIEHFGNLFEDLMLWNFFK